MKNIIFAGLMFFTVASHGEEKILIGRCSFDPQMTDFEKGDFRAGNAVANFYAVTDAQGHGKVVVAHGISKVNGYVSEASDLVNGVRVDQGETWHSYEVTFSKPGIPFQASWIDDEARIANPDNPEPSIVGYDYPNLNAVRSVPAKGSFLQNNIVGQPNAYPSCIFWKAP